MTDDRAADPAAVIREILADGPVSPTEFRRLAHKRGVPIKRIPSAAKEAGAECRRYGGVGEGGWIWMLKDDSSVDRFIKTFPDRRGYYADNIYLRGKEIQQKLADNLDEARIRVVHLIAERDAERAKDQSQRKAPARPKPPKPAFGKPAIAGPRALSHSETIALASAQARTAAAQLMKLAQTLDSLSKGA